ncbi:GHKL domain-containing protein [Chengkuizengella sp. YPA3-1-1]|uniref:GHKL domain-containing protein n=2 Tax=Chengkuizengella marina TaxID=2507566 RepID=A0A6N9Q1R5_9BACL|nr:GHKL domain-containing protein [Chengkuizengella marina]
MYIFSRLATNIEKVNDLIETFFKLFMNALPLIVIYSFPNYFLTLSFSLIFWGIPLNTVWKRILLFAIIQSIYIDLFIFTSSPQLQLINSLTSYFILFNIVFYHLNKLQKTLIPIFAYIISMTIEILVASIAFIFIPRDELLQSTLNLIYISLPTVVIMTILIYFMIKKKFSPGETLIVNIKKHKKITLLLCILIIQFIVTCFIISIGYFNSTHILSKTLFILLSIMIFLSLIIILVTFSAIKQTKNEAVRMTQKYYIGDVNRMFTSIRGQRHDFLNHVQVIYGFVKYKKYNQLENYTKELTKEISEVNEILEIGHPALAALVQSKMIISLEKKIKFQYDITGLDGLSLGITSIDIIKIIGNLIDNAIDEVETIPLDKKWISLKVTTLSEKLFITTKNPCSSKVINEKNKLFQSGFSTKEKNLHEGIGLAIVKERVEHYKGTIEVKTLSNQVLEFSIQLPLKME